MSIETVIERILKREGGYVVDHAGSTNFGITIPPYREFTQQEITDEDIKNMTKQDAIAFYTWLLKKERVAEICSFDLMDLLFDCMVNHGNKRAIRWAQVHAKVTADGILGPITLGAINANPKTIYYAVLSERIKLYAHLPASNPGKYLKYLRGWMNRACNFVKEI